MRARTIVIGIAGGAIGAWAGSSASRGVWWPAAIWAVVLIGVALRIRFLSAEIRRLDAAEARLAEEAKRWDGVANEVVKARRRLEELGAQFHRHEPAGWDGLFERCRCGATAGDLRTDGGGRAISFAEWPEEARWVRKG